MLFVLFCDPFKMLPSIKAFSLDGTANVPNTLFDDCRSDAMGLRFSSSLVLVVFDQQFCFPLVEATYKIVTKLQYSLSLKNLINELV